MLNLMKYEFQKQKASKLVLAGFLVLAELLFIIGVMGENGSILVTSVAAFSIIMTVSFFVVALEAIDTYYKDMKEKRGYMLFMTPHSTYTILGSKLLTAIVTIAVTVLVFGLLAFADVALISIRYGELAVLLEQMKWFADQLLQINISWTSFAITLANTVFGFIAMLTSAFFVITLGMTFMRQVPMKAVLFFIGYIVLNGAVDYLIGKIVIVSQITNGIAMMGIMCAGTVVFAGVCFILSGFILNKKLSL